MNISFTLIYTNENGFLLIKVQYKRSMLLSVHPLICLFPRRQLECEKSRRILTEYGFLNLRTRVVFFTLTKTLSFFPGFESQEKENGFKKTVYSGNRESFEGERTEMRL